MLPRPNPVRQTQYQQTGAPSSLADAARCSTECCTPLSPSGVIRARESVLDNHRAVMTGVRPSLRRLVTESGASNKRTL
jgi:hypothetical protein